MCRQKCCTVTGTCFGPLFIGLHITAIILLLIALGQVICWLALADSYVKNLQENDPRAIALRYGQLMRTDKVGLAVSIVILLVLLFMLISFLILNWMATANQVSMRKTVAAYAIGWLCIAVTAGCFAGVYALPSTNAVRNHLTWSYSRILAERYIAKDWNTDGTFARYWNEYQVGQKCCGVTSAADLIADASVSELPPNCCAYREMRCNTSSLYLRDGCINQLIEWDGFLDDYLICAVTVVAFASLLLALVSTVLICGLLREKAHRAEKRKIIDPYVYYDTDTGQQPKENQTDALQLTLGAEQPPNKTVKPNASSLEPEPTPEPAIKPKPRQSFAYRALNKLRARFTRKNQVTDPKQIRAMQKEFMERVVAIFASIPERTVQ